MDPSCHIKSSMALPMEYMLFLIGELGAQKHLGHICSVIHVCPFGRGPTDNTWHIIK